LNLGEKYLEIAFYLVGRLFLYENGPAQSVSTPLISGRSFNPTSQL
jgi:hypothetical protein